MGVSDEALGVIPGRTAPSADLGGSELSPKSFEFKRMNTNENLYR